MCIRDGRLALRPQDQRAFREGVLVDLVVLPGLEHVVEVQLLPLVPAGATWLRRRHPLRPVDDRLVAPVLPPRPVEETRHEAGPVDEGAIHEEVRAGLTCLQDSSVEPLTDAVSYDW